MLCTGCSGWSANWPRAASGPLDARAVGHTDNCFELTALDDQLISLEQQLGILLHVPQDTQVIAVHWLLWLIISFGHTASNIRVASLVD